MIPEGFDPQYHKLTYVDNRCPDLIRVELVGIAEQCGKRHYFNAIIRATQLITFLTQCAIDCVNGRDPNPRKVHKYPDLGSQ